MTNKKIKEDFIIIKLQDYQNKAEKLKTLLEKSISDDSNIVFNVDKAIHIDFLTLQVIACFCQQTQGFIEWKNVSEELKTAINLLNLENTVLI